MYQDYLKLWSYGAFSGRNLLLRAIETNNV